MRITAKADYAVRAAVELAAAEPDVPVKGETIARGQGIPRNFLENILTELRRAGIVRSRRGAEGGYWLLEQVSLADVATGALPAAVEDRVADPDAWSDH